MSNQKRVHITGCGFPTIRAEPRDNELLSAFPDAGTTSGIFLVSNQSTLSINALVLEGGYAEDGGGVAVLASKDPAPCMHLPAHLRTTVLRPEVSHELADEPSNQPKQ